MAYVPMNRVRALVIVHESQAYAPTRVRDATSYLLSSSASTEDEKRFATDALEWLRSKQSRASPTMGQRPSKNRGKQLRHVMRFRRQRPSERGGGTLHHDEWEANERA